MANVKGLKAKKKAGKGTPPEMTNHNLNMAPRDKSVKGKIEFSVPEEILREFEMEAMNRFGFKKGAKSNLFVAIWNEWKRDPG